MTARMALSHSRLSDYNQCPKKFWHKYINKTPSFKEEGTSPHLVRGTNVHKALENYIIQKNDNAADIPQSSLPEVETTKPLIDKMFTEYNSVLPEAQVSINDQWKQVEWFSKVSYYRAILDMIAIRPDHILITDFKTGKFRDYTPENGYGQLDMSAAIALNVWPDIPKVTTMYAYVDHKKRVTKEYTQADKPRLIEWFIKEHDKVNADTEFNPTANEHCKWCPATKLQCRFSRKL